MSSSSVTEKLHFLVAEYEDLRVLAYHGLRPEHW